MKVLCYNHIRMSMRQTDKYTQKVYDRESVKQNLYNPNPK